MKLSRTEYFRIALGAALAAIPLSIGGYYAWLLTPPSIPKTAEKAIAVFNSPRFKRLPESRQEAYFERSRELYEGLSSDERSALRKAVHNDPRTREAVTDVMVNRVFNEARQFAHRTPEQRRVIVDQVIGMQELARRRTQQPSSLGARSTLTNAAGRAAQEAERQDRRDEMQRRIQKLIEDGNPQRQAHMSEFLKAMRQRRMQLGLDPDPVIH